MLLELFFFFFVIGFCLSAKLINTAGYLYFFYKILILHWFKIVYSVSCFSCHDSFFQIFFQTQSFEIFGFFRARTSNSSWFPTQVWKSTWRIVHNQVLDIEMSSTTLRKVWRPQSAQGDRLSHCLPAARRDKWSHGTNWSCSNLAALCKTIAVHTFCVWVSVHNKMWLYNALVTITGEISSTVRRLWHTGYVSKVS